METEQWLIALFMVLTLISIWMNHKHVSKLEEQSMGLWIRVLKLTGEWKDIDKG